MKHKKCMKEDPEYMKTYQVMYKEDLDWKKMIEVIVKSNSLVGVGIVSLQDDIEFELAKYMQGY